MRLVLVLVALIAVALAASSSPNVIAGDFTSVDSVVSRSLAAWAFPTTTADVPTNVGRYPSGQFLSTLSNADAFIGGSSLRAYAQDGSVVGTNSAGSAPAANSEIWYMDNSTSQFVHRLFGFNGFFGFDGPVPTNGQPDIRVGSNYAGLIQNLAFLGSTPNRQLVVCMGDNGANNRLIVGNQALPNPSTQSPVPTNLQNQLLLFSEGSTWFGQGNTVNSVTASTPLDITPTYVPPTGPVQNNAQPGVDCSSLVAGGTSVLIRTPNGPYYFTSNVASVTANTWSAITRDPAKAPGIPLSPGITSPSPAASVYLQGTNIYFYGPNPSDQTLQQNDLIPTVYSYNSAASWSPVITPTLVTNVSFIQYVVGTDGSVYFTLEAPGGNLLPTFLNEAKMPLEDYVFVGGTQGFNYLAPLYKLLRSAAINLYFDTNYNALVVFASDLSGVQVGDHINFQSPVNDRLYYSKALSGVAMYNKASNSYIPAYGGGLDGPIARVISTSNGITYLEGGFSYAFQRFTGPVSLYNTKTGVWDYSYGASSTNVDIDGGDFMGIFNSLAVVYDVAPFSYKGNAGFLVAGEYRTADQGGTPCNSLCHFPANGGSKLPFYDAPASATSYYNATGVRLSDPSTTAAVVPEHNDVVPGLITSIVTDGSTTIYAGGSFNIAGAQGASNFAVYTLSSSNFALGWDNALGGTNGPVYSMVMHKGFVYVAGNFKTAGSMIQANNIASYNTRTRMWSTLNRGLDGTVYKVVEWGSNLLAVGTFATGSGQTLGFTGVWTGTAWAPLTTSIDEPHENCLISYCYASEISGATGVYDVYIVGKTPYFLLASGSGASTTLSLIKFDGAHTGFVTVDGGKSRIAVPTFTSTGVIADSNYMPGASYLSSSPRNSHALDLWNIEGQSEPYLPTKRVSTFNIDKKNFEDNSATGTNGFVFAVLPAFSTVSVSASASVVASMLFVAVASIVVLLM